MQLKNDTTDCNVFHVRYPQLKYVFHSGIIQYDTTFCNVVRAGISTVPLYFVPCKVKNSTTICFVFRAGDKYGTTTNCNMFHAGIKKKKPVTLGVARIQSIASIPDGSPGNREQASLVTLANPLLLPSPPSPQF
jgi:hypothetical protein